MAQYGATSPYFETGYSQFFLDVMTNRVIPKEDDDLQFTINLTYRYRPDLLAYDLYGTPSLWWVFYQRNPNTLQAPPLDFDVGVNIFLPKGPTLKTVLGY
jgi:alpha-L-fucosidase